MSKNSPPCPFGELLLRLRKERGISQYALSRTSGISERYLSYLEHGVFEPRARPTTCTRPSFIVTNPDGSSVAACPSLPALEHDDEAKSNDAATVDNMVKRFIINIRFILRFITNAKLKPDPHQKLH